MTIYTCNNYKMTTEMRNEKWQLKWQLIHDKWEFTIYHTCWLRKLTVTLLIDLCRILANLAYFIIVLTRAALEKLNKEELISLSEVNKTLERMEYQKFPKIKNTLKKCITSFEKQCWRNEQYPRCECVEIKRIWIARKRYVNWLQRFLV